MADVSEESQDINDEIYQLKRGKKLFEEARVGQADGETATEAVKWLVKSSRNGNEEATELLKVCLSESIGVVDKNLDDVRWCIRTSTWEKMGRAAASKLFRKICLEKKSLTKEEYKERVAEISNNKLEQKLLEKAVKNGLSEEAFVNRVMAQLQGKTGWSLRSLVRSDIDRESPENLPWIKRILVNPGQKITWVIDNIIETAGTQGMLWLKTLIPVQQVYMLVVLFIFSLFSVDAFKWITPLIGFYISFTLVVIWTMQMFYSRRKLNDVKVLADMLDRFSETFIQESAESAYSWSSLSPYISFFLTLPLMIIFFAIADKTWIPCAEVACISLVITVACWFALSDNYDHLALFAILLDNVSTLPAIVDNMPRIPVLHQVLNFIALSGVSWEIVPGFNLKLGLPSIAFLIVPMIFFRMAMQKSWHGIYQVMIPHLICFFWWRIFVVFYLETTWYGLLRASCGWAVLVILSPFLLVVGTLWLFFNLLKVFSLTGMMKLFTTLCLLATVALFAYWSKGGFRLGTYSLDNKSSKTNLILTLALLVSSIPLVYIVVPDDSGKPIQYLPWELYKKHCTEERWKTSFAAHAMIECHHLSKTKVNWTGIVKQITLKQVENQAENIIALMPTVLSNWLRCTYGEYYSDDCSALSSEAEMDICKYNHLQGRSCHTENLGRFTFEVTTLTEDDSTVKLVAPSVFKEVLLKLRKDDVILYRGHLAESLGGAIPFVNIYNLRCLSCPEETQTVSQDSWRIYGTLKLGMYSIFNFFLAPLLVFDLE